MPKAKTNEVDDLAQACVKAILESDCSGNANVYYNSSHQYITRYDATACHQAMGNERVQLSPVVGIAIKGYNNAQSQRFLEWVVSDDSVYWPLFNFLKDDLIIVREKDTNWIKGYVCKSLDVNNFVLHNFFKSCRTVGEHKDTLVFWDKWVTKKGKDPKIVYPLMYFVSNKNEKINSKGHSAFAQYWANCSKSGADFQNAGGFGFDLSVFADPKNNNKWVMTDKPRRSKPGYYGENNYLYGANVKSYKEAFDFHNKIPIIEDGEPLKTRFYHMYTKKKEMSYSDRTIENFIDNYKTFI